jgi:uncharacterized protein YqeY
VTAADLPDRLRQDLTAAMRERQRESVRVLRTALSAIANAEAQPNPDETPTSTRSSGPIAGAADGLGAAEVARRELDPSEIRAIVQAERDERLTAADGLAARGALDAADALRAEAALLDRYLG